MLYSNIAVFPALVMSRRTLAVPRGVPAGRGILLSYTRSFPS